MSKTVTAVERERANHAADTSQLLVALGSDDGIARHVARESLVAMGKPAVPALIGALRNPGVHVRWEAAKALTELRDHTAAPALVATLEDESFGVRWLAAEGLATLGRCSLLPLLQAVMERPDSIWLREGAHHVLSELAKKGLRDQLKPVLSALEGPEPVVEAGQAASDAIDRLSVRRRGRSKVSPECEEGR